jgi:hypothetical protein
MDRDPKKAYLDIAHHIAQRVLPSQNAKLRALAFLRNCLGDSKGGPDRAAKRDRPAPGAPEPPNSNDSASDSTR